MLYKAQNLKGYTLNGRDGEIGKIKEFFCDDHWAIRYLVADTRSWLTDWQVLIPSSAIVAVKTKKQIIDINLTNQQIVDSPALTSRRSGSRQFKGTCDSFYSRPIHWGDPHLWRDFEHDRETIDQETQKEEGWAPCLRSSQNVLRSHVLGKDGELGHVDDFLIDVETWAIRYFTIDTGNWWPEKKVMISSKWIERVNWQKTKVYVDLARETMKQAPEYMDWAPLTREYEVNLHAHYQRREYWVKPLFRFVRTRESGEFIKMRKPVSI